MTGDAAQASPSIGAIERREGDAGRRRINWLYSFGVVFIHLVALLALLPWFFSWTGVVMALLGIYLFGALGISIGYHRLLTHRSLSTPKWLERTLVTIGVMCVQGSPAFWVALHREHHQFTDLAGDPHTPHESMFHAHVGWILDVARGDDLRRLKAAHAADILSDPYYAWLDRHENWIWIVVASAAVGFCGGYLVAHLLGAPPEAAFQFACSVLVWGFVRVVAVWHITWSVNSVTHAWGYRNFETRDSSRNNPIVAHLSFGEGWHNNHHADPRSANLGRRWWEVDFSYNTIQLLEALGLATQVIRPRAHPR